MDRTLEVTFDAVPEVGDRILGQIDLQFQTMPSTPNIQEHEGASCIAVCDMGMSNTAEQLESRRGDWTVGRSWTS